MNGNYYRPHMYKPTAVEILPGPGSLPVLHLFAWTHATTCSKLCVVTCLQNSRLPLVGETPCGRGF